MKDGFDAPYARAWFNGTEVPDTIESFKYISSEDDGEECEITIRSNDRKLPSEQRFQEGATWTVRWGWLGSKKSQTRLVYIYDIKWTFDDSGIQLTITSYERGKSLKQRENKKVFQGPCTLLDVAGQIASDHGLSAEFYADPNFIQYPTVDEIALQLKTFLANNPDVDPYSPFTGGKKFDPDITFLFQNLRVDPCISQGNKTDKQLLDELGKKQPNGQFIVDTTDDKMVIRKRDFSQDPIRSYKWADDSGELQAFEPESKQAAKNGAAVNMNYDGWDKENKTYFNGNSNVGSENNPDPDAPAPALNETEKKTLAKYQKQVNDLSTKAPDFVMGHLTMRLETDNRSDATSRVQNINQPYTVLDKLNALKETINTFTGKPNNKTFNDPTAKNPLDTFSGAANNRQLAELKMNPGYFEAIGDPVIAKGQIVTILGVSKKYSGNYYITRVEHTISGEKSYMIRADIVRQGHNIQTNSDYVPYTQTDQQINKDIGQPATDAIQGLINTRTLQTMQNP